MRSETDRTQVYNYLSNKWGITAYTLLLSSEESHFTKDGSGFVSQWNDASGLENHAIQSTSAYQPQWQDGIDGSPAIFFDGSSDYLSIADSADFAVGTGDYTFESWIKYTYSADLQAVYVYRGSSHHNGLQVFLLDSDIQMFVAGASYLFNIGTVPDDTWFHLAVVRQSGTTYIYINGDKQSESTSSLGGNIISASGQIIQLGRPLAAEYWIDGYLDDVKFYNGLAVYQDSFVPTPRN